MLAFWIVAGAMVAVLAAGAARVAQAREHHAFVREELPITGLALSRSDPALPTVYEDA